MAESFDDIGTPLEAPTRRTPPRRTQAAPRAESFDDIGKPLRRQIRASEAIGASPVGLGAGAGEAALTALTGAGAGLVGGVRFLGALAQNQFADPGFDRYGRIKGVDQARAMFDAAVQGGTYQPNTVPGQMTVNALSAPFALWGEGAGIAGRTVALRTGSPAAGAATNAVLNAVPVGATRRPVVSAGRQVATTYGRAWEATSPEARLVNPRPRRLEGDQPAQSALPPPNQQALPPPGAFPPEPPAARAAREAEPAIPTPVQVVRNAQQVGRAIVEPLTRNGPEDAAVRLLARFGFKPEDFESLSSGATRTGALPTLPEQVGSVEGATAVSRLMDTIRMDPQQFAEINARDSANNQARVSTLASMAGRGGRRAAAEVARQETTSPIYERALSAEINPSNLEASQLAYMDALFDRPAIKRALADGQENLLNEGILDEPRYSLRALHAAKVALDTRISQAPRNPAETMSVASMTKARDAFVRLIEQLSPEYATARREYARLSQPINQMDIAGTILDRGTVATPSLANNGAVVDVLSPDKLRNLTAPRNQAATIKAATGRGGARSFEDVMTPDQLQMLDSIVAEVRRKAAVEKAANGPGSGTAQRLLSQNILNAMGIDNPSPLVATGIERVTRLANIVTDSDTKLRAAVADLILNPGKAKAAFERATPKRQAQRRANSPPPKP